MADELSKAELEAALAALGEVGTAVYSAYKKDDGTIVLELMGYAEPVEHKPKATRKASSKKK